VDEVRKGIRSGERAVGSFLPSVRELSDQYSVSPETVRRGLKLLEQEGLLVAEPRQGFRIVRRPSPELDHSPVAYVTRWTGDLSSAQPVNRALMTAFQHATSARGWPVLGAHVGEAKVQDVLQQLEQAHAWGVALDTFDTRLLAALRATGLPLVVVNAWFEDVPVDTVLQDNYQGAYLAARHLMDCGAKRIGWVGIPAEFIHARQRYAGAQAALLEAGTEIPPDLRLLSGGTGSDLEGTVRALLTRRGRPDGVLALWKGRTELVHRVATELGLVIGEDFHLVGWEVDEVYESEFLPMFDGGPVPPAITWKATTMVDAVLTLLAERRAAPQREPFRINVPTQLRMPA
jgi:DNA-binding LacI/PurR family transcriptional regulator